MKPEQQDEHAGHGGSYLIDAKGKRTLVHRTEAPQPQAPAAQASAEATTPPATAKKE